MTLKSVIIQRSIVFFLALTLTGITSAAAAPPGFSSSAASESFENLNRPDVSSAIINLPTPFTFPSGLSIVSPVPNAIDSSGVFIVEGGFFGFSPGPNGEGIPDGEAYLGQGNPGLTDPIRLAFPQTVVKVGAYVSIDGVDEQMITVSALDASSSELASTVVTSVGPAEWPQHFITLFSPGISSLQFAGTGSGVLRVDLVTWDVVPEPSAALLTVVGVLQLIGRRRRY
jgi:hypothetical protein